jgi:hypothetical protein
MAKRRRAAEYWQKAGETRQKADATNDPVERQELLEIAAALEQWAAAADERAALYDRLARPQQSRRRHWAGRSAD